NADFRPLSYFPLSLLSWQDAIHAVFKERVSVVAEYDQVVRSPSVTMRIPSVVALRDYQPAPKRVAFTRFNVFLRDRFTCQYCGDRNKSGVLPSDHAVPGSKGGPTSWENIVAACHACNQGKDDRHLKPLQRPRQPSARELHAAQREFPPNYLHESWLDYLYWDAVIDTAS